MSRNAYSIFAVSLLAVLFGTAAIYWRGLDGPFLLDDFLNIVDAYVSDFVWEDIYYAITHNVSGELGRPVSTLSLVFSGIVHGPSPWGYKFHNLIIHLMTGLLIFWLLVKILPRMLNQENNSSDNNLFIAGISATLWLLHPLLVSTVLYSVQRMAQLSALFTMAALIAFVAARETGGDQRTKFYLSAYFLFPLFLLLSAFSKENGALIPVYVLAIEFIVFRFSYDTNVQRNRQRIFLGIFVVAPILIGSVYILTHLEQLADYSLRSFTMFDRVLTQLHVVAMYLKMILLPRLSDMTLFHDYIRITTGFDITTILLSILFLGGFFLIFHCRKKAPVISFAIAWFVVSHLLESTIFNLELMFEHRNYLAAAGPLFALVYYVSSVPAYPQLKYLNLLFIVMLAFLTTTRVGEWRSNEVIYEIAVMEHPDSQRALTAMANMKYQSGKLDEALALLKLMQQNDPQDFGPYAHEAVYRCGSGASNDELFSQAEEKARQFPITPYAFNALDFMVAVLNKKGCEEITPAKVLRLVQVAKEQENNRNNQQYLGFLEKIEGQIYLIMGRTGEGIRLIWSAYTKTGLTIILAQLTENLLQLNLIGDAEIIVRELEIINDESRGRETALLRPLQELLKEAKDQTPQIDVESVSIESSEAVLNTGEDLQ